MPFRNKDKNMFESSLAHTELKPFFLSRSSPETSKEAWYTLFTHVSCAKYEVQKKRDIVLFLSFDEGTNHVLHVLKHLPFFPRKFEEKVQVCILARALIA